MQTTVPVNRERQTVRDVSKYDSQCTRRGRLCDSEWCIVDSSMIHSGRGVVPQPPWSIGSWQYSIDACKLNGAYQNISVEPPYCPIDCTISVQHW